MLVEKTDQFLLQTNQFSFRCTCPDCVHFNPNLSNCSLLWPNAGHLPEVVLSPEETHVSFCKDFDVN